MLDRESYKRRMETNPEYKMRKLSQQTTTYLDKKEKPTYIYSNYVRMAKKKGYPFKLSRTEFYSLVTDTVCVYCDDKSFGVDRIDNNIGYTILNCVSCCGICNMMKGKHSVEFFISQCMKIQKNV